MNNKILELDVLLSEVNPNIFCVSEHWLNHDDIGRVHLEEYRLVCRSGRTESRGGGTAIFVKNAT